MYRLQRIPVAPGYLLVAAAHYECGECDADKCSRILLPEGTSPHACLDGMVADWYPADHVSRLDARPHLFAHPEVVPHMSVSADTDVVAADHAWKAAPPAGWGAWLGFVASGLFLVYTLYRACGSRTSRGPRARQWHFATARRPPKSPAARAPRELYEAPPAPPPPTERVQQHAENGAPWTEVWSRRNASWC